MDGSIMFLIGYELVPAIPLYFAASIFTKKFIKYRELKTIGVGLIALLVCSQLGLDITWGGLGVATAEIALFTWIGYKIKQARNKKTNDDGGISIEKREWEK